MAEEGGNMIFYSIALINRKKLYLGKIPKTLYLIINYSVFPLLCQVYVLQDTELMKFVFDRDPSSVQRRLPDFKEDISKIFPQPLKFHIYDTEFYSKVDGSLDFGRTR